MSVILDDRDSDIIYSSGWTLGGASTEYNSTTTYTDQAGATMTLNFRGIGIAVYGTIGSSNANKVAPQTTYQLDGGDAITYEPTLMQSAQHYQRFYQSQNVSKGQHTLVVTNLIAGCDPYFIDYLVVQTGNDTSSGTLSSVPTQTMGSDLASKSDHHPTRTAVIVGSVFGAIGGISLFILAYFLLRWWRKKQKWHASTEVASSGVAPFHTTSEAPASDNPKMTETNSALAGDHHGNSSYRDSVGPPAYIP